MLKQVIKRLTDEGFHQEKRTTTFLHGVEYESIIFVKDDVNIHLLIHENKIFADLGGILMEVKELDPTRWVW